MKFLKVTLVVIALTWIAGSPPRGLADTPSETVPESSAQRLSASITPWLDCLAGRTASYAISGKAVPVIDGKAQAIQFKVVRYDKVAFDLQVTHADYAVEIRRRADAIALAVPRHNVVFMGRGAADLEDHLAPEGALSRLISSGSSIAFYTSLLSNASGEEVADMLIGLTKLTEASEINTWTRGESTNITFTGGGKKLKASVDGVEIELELSTAPSSVPPVDGFEAMTVKKIPRHEIETQLARGLRRAGEVLAPSRLLTSPSARDQRVPHGELRWVDGQRVVMLQGTPEEIGVAHGQLLKEESYRCIDSVLYAFGTFQTVVNGRWFREDLENAYARLSPHIPERHKLETRALAQSLGLEAKLVEAVNVFPELFHCSGFAVFGKATKDGKLYHGRVLDYMTTIGLQDSATTFIIAAQGKIPFANVGYAGFIGSVSGMNAEKISLGEMGGKGEGQWDGVPMATLMRRGLEECSSLSQVKQLWRESPRTCEYYYVFADGEDNTAVGVAATPDSIEFIEPGQSDARLGEGIADTVVLSAGSRLDELRSRVKQRYGQLDATAGQWLMCRPVAMTSNLHNVLFVPEDGVLYIANADHEYPAADRPYVRLDLNELIQAMRPDAPAKEPVGLNLRLEAKDSLAPAVESRLDSQQCLDGLVWQPANFQVTFEEAATDRGDWLVRFPSARPSGDSRNDRVAMEWYQAKSIGGDVLHAPAAVIVHESGSGMTVGRLIAQGLRQRGIHAFMVQLPYYGERRDPNNKPSGDRVFLALQQAIADVRRAKDAVAAVPHVDATRISLQGTSLGGFVTATTAGLDHGYHRVIIFLAGGDLYSVLMQGKQDAANLRRDLENQGIDAATIKESLRSIEPLRLAHRIDPRRTWMFSGAFDDVVPIQNADLLAAAAQIDQSHHRKLLANHYSGIIFLPMVMQQMRDIMIEPASLSLAP